MKWRPHLESSAERELPPGLNPLVARLPEKWWTLERDISPADWQALFGDEERKAAKLDEATAVMLFQTGESRRYTIDQMMWQVPALTLTAQAFLLQLAYGHDIRWIARVMAALVGMAMSAAGIQLLLRHRYHEELNSHWLEQLAASQDWPTFHVPARAEAFAFKGGQHKRREAWSVKNRLSTAQSPPIWILGLALFGIANLVVIIAWVVHLIFHTNAF